MSEETHGLSHNLIEMAGEIVAAYVSNNYVQASELPGLIVTVHRGLADLAKGPAAVPEAETVEQPSAAQIRKSVQHEGLVSFIDGKSYKTLKRHLTANGLTPEGYRARYGLPADYPMTASSYSEMRSGLAKAHGLGVPGGMAEQASPGRKAA